MKLYQVPLSPNCRKALLVARHLGLQIEVENVDLPGGAHKAPEFLQKNPNGKVPVLEHDGRTLWESNAIMCYLASQKDNSLWPKNQTRYDIMKWQHWQSCHWGPAVGPFVFERVIKRGGPDAPVSDQAKENLARYAAVLNGHLEASPYLVGESLTLADFCVGADFTYESEARLPLSSYSHIQRWIGSIRELDAWKETQPQLG